VVYNSGKFYEHLNLVGSGGIDDDAYTVVSLNFSYTSPSERWVASLWGNNVFDEEYYRTGIVAFGTLGRDAIAGNPAHYGLTLKFSF
jgi:outer membrane receptor protein involved in Fe transport